MDPLPHFKFSLIRIPGLVSLGDGTLNISGHHFVVCIISEEAFGAFVGVSGESSPSGAAPSGSSLGICAGTNQRFPSKDGCSELIGFLAIEGSKLPQLFIRPAVPLRDCLGKVLSDCLGAGEVGLGLGGPVWQDSFNLSGFLDVTYHLPPGVAGQQQSGRIMWLKAMVINKLDASYCVPEAGGYNIVVVFRLVTSVLPTGNNEASH